MDKDAMQQMGIICLEGSTREDLLHDFAKPFTIKNVYMQKTRELFDYVVANADRLLVAMQEGGMLRKEGDKYRTIARRGWPCEIPPADWFTNPKYR